MTKKTTKAAQSIPKRPRSARNKRKSVQREIDRIVELLDGTCIIPRHARTRLRDALTRKKDAYFTLEPVLPRGQPKGDISWNTILDEARQYVCLLQKNGMAKKQAVGLALNWVNSLPPGYPRFGERTLLGAKADWPVYTGLPSLPLSYFSPAMGADVPDEMDQYRRQWDAVAETVPQEYSSNIELHSVIEHEAGRLARVLFQGLQEHLLFPQFGHLLAEVQNDFGDDPQEHIDDLIEQALQRVEPHLRNILRAKLAPSLAPNRNSDA